MENKISLAVTSYNPNVTLLRQMLDSAAAFDEIILHVDVGTERRVDIDPSDYPKMKVYPNEQHLDIKDGFNWVISNTQGEWVCVFYDDDFFHAPNVSELIDLIHSERLENMDKADVIHFPCLCIHEGGDVAHASLWGASHVSLSGLQQNNMIPAGSFFRRSLWQKVGGFNGDILHDWVFWMKCVLEGARFIYHDKPIYYYRIRSDSASHRQMAEYEYNIDRIRTQVMTDAKAGLGR